MGRGACGDGSGFSGWRKGSSVSGGRGCWWWMASRCVVTGGGDFEGGRRSSVGRRGRSTGRSRGSGWGWVRWTGVGGVVGRELVVRWTGVEGVVGRELVVRWTGVEGAVDG